MALVLAGMSVPVTGSAMAPVSVYAEEQSEDFIIRDGVLRAYLGNDEHVTIPDGVTAIGDYAFYGCTGLTEVTIPDSVVEIGNNAFYGCTGLTEINIPRGVTVIPYFAFYNCKSLLL